MQVGFVEEGRGGRIASSRSAWATHVKKKLICVCFLIDEMHPEF